MSIPLVRSWFVALLLAAGCFAASGSLSRPTSTQEQLQSCAAAFRGSVASVSSYVDPADGLIYTRVVLQVDEVFKGKLPARVRLIHRGGMANGRGEVMDSEPQFKVGEERLLFVSRRANGTLFARAGSGALHLPPTGTPAGGRPEYADGLARLAELQRSATTGSVAGEDLSDQAATTAEAQASPEGSGGNGPLVTVTATNLLIGVDGIPARFIAPDGGDAIPYLVDADRLPTGMTLAQALNAVQSAIAAWTNVTSLRYRFAGVQGFGQPAANIQNGDGYLRIQLHDLYHSIGGGGGSGDTLGVGGHVWTTQVLSPGWTSGGNVKGSDFHKAINGYVTLADTNVFMQNPANFAEVLCHEIGHTIGLAHSSENFSEPNPFLKQAIMYYLAHDSGRGATISNYDINVVRQVHPQDNTPPACFDRYMDIISYPSAPAPIGIPGVNTVQVRGYDLQSTSLTFATTDASGNNGTFSAVNSNITYTPKGFFLDSSRAAPGSGSAFDRFYARYSDGTNASAFATISVVSLTGDTYSEGIPNWWRAYYFGNADPSVGSNHHATNDADGDGFSNLVEWWMGSNPTNKNSNLRISSVSATNLQWAAKGYEVYELYSSTNLTTWTRSLPAYAPLNFLPGTNLLNITNSIGVAFPTNGGPKQFFRLQKVP